MKRALLVLFVLTGIMTAESLAQDNMGIGTSTPEPSAVLDLDATDKGFLAPRLNTVQRVAIAAPATGLMVYDTNDNKFWFFDGTIWVQSVGPSGADGTDGLPGADGVDGAAGADGVDGAAGADGVDGAAGADGVDGAAGADGVDGAAGADGVDGAAGADGVDGAAGADGVDGAAGADGVDGAAGADGVDGAAGAD
ncbi:MAG: Ca2+-binding RTX toxin-like protein, partial [Psychroserpens sp.]